MWLWKKLHRKLYVLTLYLIRKTKRNLALRKFHIKYHEQANYRDTSTKTLTNTDHVIASTIRMLFTTFKERLCCFRCRCSSSQRYHASTAHPLDPVSYFHCPRWDPLPRAETPTQTSLSLQPLEGQCRRL